jgi:hypothetical protein
MNIKYKGPTALVFDVSSLIGTLDEGGELSLLAWQFVIERELVEKAGLTLVSTTPRCKSLERQYRQIHALQDRFGMTFIDQLDRLVVAHLQYYVVAIEMTNEILVMVKRKRLSLE